MEIIERKLKGVFEIRLFPHYDERGFFMRTLDVDTLTAAGLNHRWVQENHSSSKKKNTIRGLHFQLPPFDETKLIRCVKGSVLDVFVDIRPKSETFGKWGSIKLSDKNNKMVCIPRGFAHGFLTLEDNCDVLYKVDNYYSPNHERGLIWNDSNLNINWNTSGPIISKKDKMNMTFQNYIDSMDLK